MLDGEYPCVCKYAMNSVNIIGLAGKNTALKVCEQKSANLSQYLMYALRVLAAREALNNSKLTEEYCPE